MDKQYFDIKELSDYLCIKVNTLYGKVHRKEIPFYKLGGLIRFKKTDIDAWLEDSKYTPTPENRPVKLVRVQDSRQIDINDLIHKTIESVKGNGYNSVQQEARLR